MPLVTHDQKVEAPLAGKFDDGLRSVTRDNAGQERFAAKRGTAPALV